MPPTDDLGSRDLAGTEGCPIFTADHKAIGHVKEVAGVYFKVDVRGRPDYWLSQDDVQVATANQVILNWPEKDLGSHKRDQPGPGPRGHADTKGDVIA